MAPQHKDLLEPEQLFKQLDDPDLMILDGSMQKTVSGPNHNYGKAFIEGTCRFDFEHTFCDSSSHLPHTLPTPETFTVEARKLGIRQTSKLVIYDDKGIYSAPRVWWMFKTMGHNNVSVLNGGLPKWKRLGYPVTPNSWNVLEKGDFTAESQTHWLYSVTDVFNAIGNDAIQLIDVRSPARFAGQDPEPRAGLRSGHIPSAINIPFQTVVNDSQYIDTNELSNRFNQLIKSAEQTLVFNCGSGVTSCVVALAAHLCGYDKLAVYDGSWTEWGTRTDLPIETS